MKSLTAFIAQVRDDFSGVTARSGIDPLLTAARVLLYVLLIGVVISLVVTVIGIVLQVIGQNVALIAPPSDPVWRPIGRLLLGFIALCLVQTIVHHLLAMIRAVAHGEAFAPANVGRIEKIAGHVLGLQVLGTFARIVRLPVGGEIAGFDLGVALSPAGIAFVLLLFILARVFRQGAAMREELEGTV
jgi:hypothetical protein